MKSRFVPLGANVFEMSGVGDGVLAGIVVREKQAELHFKLYDRTPCCLIIPNLESLVANDFRQGNIITKVIVSPQQFCTDEMLMQAYGYGIDEWPQYSESTHRKLQKQSWAMVEVVPSYGCSLSAIFFGTIENLLIENSTQ